MVNLRGVIVPIVDLRLRLGCETVEYSALTVVIDSSEMLGADRWTSHGHLEGRPDARAVFAWNAGFLHASIADA